MGAAVIRVAIVDDQPLFSAGLRMLIEAQSDMECVGTAQNGRDAVTLAAHERPDIVLMDLRMPKMNGIDATRGILAGVPADEPPHVIVLTTIGKDEAVYQAFQAGASAFLTKDATPAEVLTTIRGTLAGQALPDAASALDLVHQYGQPQATASEGALDALSAREQEVFLLVARGLSNSEIAEAVFLSDATVKSHVRAILQKLGLKSRVQVVVFAYQNGLLAAWAQGAGSGVARDE